MWHTIWYYFSHICVLVTATKLQQLFQTFWGDSGFVPKTPEQWYPTTWCYKPQHVTHHVTLFSQYWVLLQSNYSPDGTVASPHTLRGLWLRPKGIRTALKELPSLPFEGFPSPLPANSLFSTCHQLLQPVPSLISYTSESFPFFSSSKKPLKNPNPSPWFFCAWPILAGIITYHNSCYL